MKKQINKYLAVLLGIICVILLGVLIFIKSENNTIETKSSDLSSKVIEEMNYLENNIVDTMNKLNNITVLRYKVYTKSLNEEKSNSTSESDSGSSSTGSSSSSSEGEQSSSKNSTSQNSINSNSTTVSQSSPVSSLNLTNSNEINWDSISFLYENMYSIWPTINLDLQSLGITTESINTISIDLDGVAQSIKAKDKNSCLINLYNMYSQIPKYISVASQDNDLINITNTKLAILNAYVLSNQDKWKDMSSSVSSAKQYFETVLASSNKSENEKISLQKTYIMIEELERTIQLNDKDIFFMSYKNVMQELEK